MIILIRLFSLSHILSQLNIKILNILCLQKNSLLSHSMDPEVNNEQEDKKQDLNNLVFKQYPSIQLSTRDKVIKAIRQHGYDQNNILWVASEKIHGSNFSIHCSGEKIRYGRRTDFLTDDIELQCDDPGKHFKESFYDARNLVKTFHNKVQNVWKTLKQIYPDIVKFAIYGQYFGGTYPGIDQKFKHVQKGVFYIPHHEFMAFDIRVFTSVKTFWVDVTDIPKCLGENLKSVPIYARGTFEEIFNINSKIDSTIPELLGFPKVQKNIIEGFVIRPNTSLKLKNNDRVILKKKNEEFVEAAKAPNPNKQKDQKAVVALDPEIVPYIQALEVYLNNNRIDSVVSKFPDLKDRNKLKTQIIKDIMSDAAKDQYKEAAGQLGKKVKTEFDKRVMKALNEYFVKH